MLLGGASWPPGLSVQWTREQITEVKCNSGMLTGGRAAPPPGGAPRPVLEHQSHFPVLRTGADSGSPV